MTDQAPKPAPKAALNAGVIFDRDGVLNVDHGYVFQPEHLTWMPGARQAVARATRAGLTTAVATNQSGVGRGYYTLDQLALFHDELQRQLAEVGGRIDAFYACAHHEDAVIEQYRQADHPLRKPNPGMLLAAIADLGLDPARTLMVGDRQSDMEAARRAGVHGALYEGGDLERFLADRLAAIGVKV
jgi:D-glycero-D-manno-heptose 1,7-bisphosphate phosphatase